MFLTLIIALLVTITKRNKYKKLKFFPFYFGFFIVRLSIRYAHIYNSGYPPNEDPFYYFDGFFEYLLVMLELLIFMQFFYQVLYSSNKKKIIKFLCIIFVIFGISRLINDSILYSHIIISTITQMFFLEAVLLLISCFLYYLQIFKSPPTLKLLNEPSFFVVTGLFFFLICSFPYSLFLDLISNYPSIYRFIFSIIYIFYILLFLMVIKAFYVNQRE